MKTLRFLLVGLLAAGAVLAPSAAVADESVCADTYLARDGRELFSVEPQYVPPPLRAFPADCASRVAGDPFVQESGTFVAYVLLYADISPQTVFDMLRSFENAGWIVGPSIGAVDFGEGPLPNAPHDTEAIAELAATEGNPLFIRARFSDANTGEDIIELTYADGDVYDNNPALPVPTLTVTVLGNRTYSATGIADPSVLSTLRTIAQAAPNPVQTGVLCTSAVMLMLVVGWPGSLLSSTVSSRYEQLFSWTKRGLPDRIRAALRKTQPRWLVWVGFVAAAIVAGFVDPAFGINPMSARMLVTGFLSFLVFNVLGWALVSRVVRRIQPDAKPVVNFRWGSLVIVLVAVLVARLLEFSPGVIFGLVAGLTYAITLVASRKALVVLVGSGFALAAGLVAWIGYSLLAPLASASDGNLALVAITEFLSSVTIEGASSLPLALLPFAALDGGDLIAWKKWVWGVSYAVGLGAFMLVLLTVPDSFAEMPGDFVRWTALFAGYAILAVGIWGVNSALLKRKSTPAAEPKPASTREPAAPAN